MLAIFTYFFLISFTCLWAGFFIQHVFGNILGPGEAKHWIVTAIWGVVVITLFGQILELFMPVNQFSWLAFVLLLCLYSIARRKLFVQFIKWLANFRAQSVSALIIYSMLAITVCVLSAGPVMMDDTESYHMQMIKWIQEYGTVRGIANLHERYGFNSSWFTFSGLFIPMDTGRNFLSMANGLLSIWLGFYLYDGFKNWSKANGFASVASAQSCFLLLLVTLFCWPMFRGNATNANYDFITTCIVVVIFVELWKQNKDYFSWKAFLPELLIWPVFLFTVRMINYPFLLISLFAFVNALRHEKPGFTVACTLVSLMLAVPFLARNLLLTGYLLYPFYGLDIFRVDWKVNTARIDDLLTYIKYFNRVNAGFKPIAETQRLAFPGWIPVWYHYLFSYDKPFVILGGTGYLLAIVRFKKVRSFSFPVKLLLCTMVLQLVSWFLVAPDPRFVYGPILAGIFLIPVLVNEKFTGLMANGRKFVPILSTCLFASLFFYAANKVIRDDAYLNFALPVKLPVPDTRLISLDGIHLQIPSKIYGNWNPRCYATPLPCLYEIQPGLRARGKSIKDGFRIDR